MYMFDCLSVVRLLILAVFTLIFGERSGSDLTGGNIGFLVCLTVGGVTVLCL